MNENTAKKRIEIDSAFCFCVIIVGVIIYLLVSTLLHFNDSNPDEQTVKYSEGWTYEDGTSADFNHLKAGAEVVVSKQASGEEVNGRMLCFYSKNVYFSVYMEGDQIYDFHPNAPKAFGKAYGILPHSVNLPVMNRDGELRIVIHSIYPDNPGYLKDMILNNGNQYMLDALQGSALDFVMCLLVFAFGAVLFGIGLFGRSFKDKRDEIISAGAFAMVTALWVCSETTMLPVLLGAPVAVHFIDYVTLDLLSLPGVIFVASATGCKKKWITMVFAVLTAAKIGYSVWSTWSGGKDYHQLLILTHILLVCTVVTVLALVIFGGVRHRMENHLSFVLLLALLFSIAMGVVDIVRYLTMPNEYRKASYYKYAVLFFIFMCGVYEFMQIAEMSRRGQYAEIMEEMAYKDGLTGLLNRMAYNRELEAAAKKDTPCTLIMLDMNYLKKVNDERGHDRGDMYIFKIAEFMQKSFCHGEKSFRIGGDEFFVLAEYTNEDPLFSESIQNMKHMVDEFNENFGKALPLSIAYGYSVFRPGETDLDEQVRIADQKMYKMKVEMKAGMAFGLASVD